MITPLLRFRCLSILQFGFVTIAFAANPTPVGKGPGVQPASSPAQTKPATTPPAPGTIDEKLFNRMQWRQIGPCRRGRVLAIEGIPGDPETYIVGAVAGGVWKTSDGGATWT